MKTKAIKTLALLLVLTLTMSVMGVSAMAASHDVVMNVNNADVSNYILNSKYTLAEFESDLENSEYVAFFNFDSAEDEANINMDAAITNSEQTSAITFSTANISGSGSSSFSRVEVAAGTIARNHNWASGNSSGLIFANSKVTFTFPTVNDGLKPVAVGFFMSTQRTGVSELLYAPEVTYNVGSEKATPTSLAVGQDLAFCGFKAEGRYLTSLTVYGDETTSMRLDDFCVIYAEDIYGINTNNGTTADSPTAYDEDMFYKDFNNSQYSVLYDFDATKTNASYSVSNGYNLLLSAPIIGTDSQTCDITSNKFKESDGTTNYKNAVSVLPDFTSTDNPNYASGDDMLLIMNDATLTLPLPVCENLKPVAVGYYTSSHKDKAYSATVAATFNSSAETSYTIDSTTAPTALRFCGFRAPAGDYLTTIKIVVASGQNMRVDDICVIYENADKIASDIRISSDEDGNDGLYYAGDVNAEDSLYATVPAARGEDNDIILAVYGTDGKLIKVAMATEGSMQAAITNLTTVKGEDRITAVKAFVWNKDTLVPVGVNASIE